MPDDLRPAAGAPAAVDWRTHGIRVVTPAQKTSDTPETLGMNRQAALSGTRTGAQKLWAGTNLIHPNSATGAHHHGPLDSVIYVIRGRAHMRWGDRLEFIAEAGPGSFIQVPAWMPHQEINASATEELHCALVRSGPEEVVVNLPDLVPVETPEWVRW